MRVRDAKPAPASPGAQPEPCEDEHGESIQLRTYRIHLQKLDASRRAIDRNEPLARQVGELCNFLRQLSNLEVRVRAAGVATAPSQQAARELLESLQERQRVTKAEAEELKHRMRCEAPVAENTEENRAPCTLSDAVEERLRGFARRLEADPHAQRLARLRLKARQLDEAHQEHKASRAAREPRADYSADLARAHGALTAAAGAACDWSDARAAMAAVDEAASEQRTAWRSLQSAVAKIRADMTEEQAFFGHLAALQGTDHADLDQCRLELERRRELRVRLVGLADAVEQMTVRQADVQQHTEAKALDWRPIVAAISELRDIRSTLEATNERLKMVELERGDFGKVLRDMNHQFKKWDRFQDAMKQAGKSDHISHDHMTDHLGGKRPVAA